MASSAGTGFDELRVQLYDDTHLVVPLCEFILENASNTHAIKQRTAEFATDLLRNYRKWIAPWLQMDSARMRCVGISTLRVSCAARIDWDHSDFTVHMDSDDIKELGEDGAFDVGYDRMFEIITTEWHSTVAPAVRAELAGLIDERCCFKHENDHNDDEMEIILDLKAHV